MNVRDLQKAPRLYCGICDNATLHVKGKCIGCEASTRRELEKPRKQRPRSRSPVHIGALLEQKV